MESLLLTWTLLLLSSRCSASTNQYTTTTMDETSNAEALAISPNDLPSIDLKTPVSVLSVASTISEAWLSSHNPMTPSRSEIFSKDEKRVLPVSKTNDEMPTTPQSPETGLPIMTSNSTKEDLYTTFKTSADDLTTMTSNSTKEDLYTTFKTSADDLTTMTSKNPEEDPSITFQPKLIIDSEDSTVPSTTQNVNFTTTDQKEPSDHGMNSTHHPWGGTVDKPKPSSTHGQEGGNQGNEDNNKDKAKIVLIVVIIAILILLLIISLILIIRKKRRSGSQTFQTRSKKSDRQDVWAGQVPELADGKMVQDPVGMENGTAGNGLEPGKELTTFVSGENKVDSAVEMDELVAGGSSEGNGADKLGEGDSSEEDRPLLEANSQGTKEPEEEPEELFPSPPMEQVVV